MSAAWFLAWLANVASAWVFLAVLFGVPVGVVAFDWWRNRR